MKLIDTKDAVGHVLCHDITQIIKDVSKGVVFHKGHVIKEEDIEVLLSCGKEHLYVFENEEGMLHENEGAAILAEISKGDNLRETPVKEGKIELIAETDGLLKVNSALLRKINSFGDMMIASRRGNFTVKAGDKIAGTRVIPLMIKEEKMNQARELVGNEKIFHVKPFQKKKVGIVTTGSEVYHGRIQDTFTPVIINKFKEFDTEVIGHEICDDKPDMITDAILKLIKEGADVVVCTGGMSVDPDDRTPLAIKNTGAKIITYGAPVLPGAMFLLSYYNDNIPVMGLPGCVMYAGRTIFDLVLPRIIADDKISKEELDELGEGGLCLKCDVCTFPNCSFGR